ncbi:MAG TPA: Rod shape-determining protein MreD [Cytophagales bacterium]|nr:Rod shape-determining protein MreD [Cytophagales bacterium]HAA23654.1 Rod shape-determining protein MreD [Cytophagales bacterium]HAP59270.1 Rod shape-determining protein MreD [Cytophagales bacterium]
MNLRSAPIQFVLALLYIVAQAYLGSQLVLFETAFTFLHVGFLLMLPFEVGPIALMLVGFFMGLGVDVFSDTLGIHAVAGTVMMFMRPGVVNILMPQGGIESGILPSLRMMGLSWYLRYALSLILVHHLVLFFLEAFTFRYFLHTFTQALASTVITFMAVVIIQLSFYRKKRI